MWRSPTAPPKKSSRRAVPVQKRSEETFARILDAGMQLLEETGLAGFNTNAVAKAADVNVATMYHYFADKNALLSEMYLCSEGWHHDDGVLSIIGGGEISARFVSPVPLGVDPAPRSEWPTPRELHRRKGWRVTT